MKSIAKNLNKNILILGYGNTGKSIGKYLKDDGLNIFYWDDNKSILNSIKKKYGQFDNHALKIFDCVYVSPGFKKNHKIIKEARKHNVKVSSDIELFLAKLKTTNKKNNIIAITGTNGKSTIALMISKALGTKPLGNFGNPVLNNFPKRNQEVVIELSSFQLDYLNYIKPKISIISNIKEDHLEYHETFDNYAKSKIKISKFLDKNDYLILNYDDQYLRKVFYNNLEKKTNIIWVSSQKKISKGISFVSNNIIDNYFTKSKTLIRKKSYLNQNHNKNNFVISFAALKCLKLDNKQIIKSLAKFRGLPHRTEYIGTLNNIEFYNDSKATNVAATCSALEGFNKVFLIAGGSKKAVHYNLLKKYTNKIYEAYLIGETAIDIKKVLDKGCKSFICTDLEDAVIKSYLKSCLIQKKYPILLSPACASYDDYKNFEDRGNHFKRVFNKISRGKALV